MLTTAELHERIDMLRDSNPRRILSRLRETDAKIAEAEAALEDARQDRRDALREVCIDLFDWKTGTLRRAGLVLPDPDGIAPSPFAPNND